MDEWKFSRIAKTMIGMNLDTGELQEVRIYACPKCGHEVSEDVLKTGKVRYCSWCGHRNYAYGWHACAEGCADPEQLQKFFVNTAEGGPL